MTRAQLIEVFLATLDEIAEAPHFVGGAPGRPTLDCDTVMSSLLEQVANWHEVPYRSVRAMFAALLEGAPMDDVERIVARVNGELESAERCAAEAAKEDREAAALAHAREVVDMLGDDPEKLRHVPARGHRRAQLAPHPPG